MKREQLAFDLVMFCGLRASEVYGLKNGDLREGRGNPPGLRPCRTKRGGVGFPSEGMVAPLLRLPRGGACGGNLAHGKTLPRRAPLSPCPFNDLSVAIGVHKTEWV